MDDVLRSLEQFYEGIARWFENIDSRASSFAVKVDRDFPHVAHGCMWTVGLICLLLWFVFLLVAASR